ncbi:MAG: VOC family protein [Planctomycetota bacterium]
MQKIRPCLWFNDNAEEAVKFYTSVFRNSNIGLITRYGPAAAKASGRPEGSVMTIMFEIEGQEFMALNGGPEFTFSPAISLMVDCATQAELDELWEKLSAGGEKWQCGWLKDRFGVAWQIIPAALGEMLRTAAPKKLDRVMQALVQMQKLELGPLQEAYEQG